jgi:putative ABC transport system substrate-binding protein
MERRRFMAVLTGALLAAPLAAEAAPTRIGLVAQDLQPSLLETFRGELKRRGYTEGQDITIEVRNAAGHSDRLPALVDELVRLKVAVIVAVNTPAAQAAKKATSTIPIVILRVADPVGQGLVGSLARPGGNVTGLAFMPDVLGAKGVEMLHEIVPSITRVASLYKADNPGALLVVTETERRSLQLGLHFVRLPVAGPADLPAVFQAAVRARTEAVFVMDDGAMTKQRQPLLELAARHSLPVVSIYKDFAEAGGFIAYGPSLTEMYRGGAQYVDRILKGAKPGGLPIEQPRKFDLLINLKTAKALGLTIQPLYLARADQIIE